MDIVFSLAIILVESACCVIFFQALMEKKEIFNNIVLDYTAKLAILTIPSFLISYYVDNHIIKMILVVGLFFGSSYAFYYGRPMAKVSASAIIYMTILVLDAFTIVLLMLVFDQPYELIMESTRYFPLGAMISKVLLSILIVLFRIVILRKRKAEYIAKRDWFILVLLSFITIVALLSLMVLCTMLDDIPSIVLPAAIGLLFSTLLVFMLLESAAGHGRNLRESALIQQQLDIKLSSMASLKSAYDAQKAFMHDYKNHMSTIMQLIDTHSYEDLSKYVRGLTNQIYHSIYRFKSNNDVVDVILNQKDQEASRQGITLDVRLGDLSALNLPPEDLLIIVANVLDNAIEACATVQTEKIVIVKLAIEENFFIFSVINPVAEPVKIIDNKIPTTKKDTFVHGLGLQNVAQALGRCGGEFAMDCQSLQFQFTTLIRLRPQTKG